MVGKPGQHALEDLVIEPLERQPAASLVGDGEDAVDIGELRPPAAVAEPVGNGARGAGRAIDRADHRDVVARPDAAVGAKEAPERPEPLRRGHRRPLAGKRVIALEQVGPQVVHVHVGPGGNVPGGKPDNLAVFPDRFTLGDRAERHLVAQVDGLADFDRDIRQIQSKTLGNGPGGHCHVVVASEQNGPGRFGGSCHSWAPRNKTWAGIEA